MTWHASTDLLTEFARAPEALDAATAASIEAHLLGCSLCRQGVADAGDPEELSESWRLIADVVDRPRAPLTVRVLCRLGVPFASARLVGATRELAIGWLAAIVGSVTAAVLFAHLAGSPGPFLAIAPMVPALVVWLAFAPIADPAGEAGVATPLAGAGLMLRRLLVAEIPAVLALTLAAVVVPGASLAAASWLLPGSALAVGCLALATSMRVVNAASLTTVAWIAVLAIPAAVDRHRALADSFVFGPSGQLAALAFVGIGVLRCWYRRDRFATVEVTW